MAKVKISNKVFRLKFPQKLNVGGVPEPIQFSAGQEFHIVADVLYMNGFPVPPSMQNLLLNWVLDNPLYFVEDTRNF